MLLFLAVLLMTHSFSPALTNILDLISIPKEHFFYSFLIGMLLVNIFVLVLGGLGLNISKNLLFIPKRDFWTSSINTKKIFLEKFKLWLKGLALVFNLFFVVFVAAIAKINIEQAPQLSYIFFMLVLGFVFLAWLVYYFIWFTNIKDTQKELGLI
jgi:hypothetical protein